MDLCGRPAHWPDWANDEVVTRVTIKFGWWDRLKILLFGNCQVTTRTVTERPPGRFATSESVSAWIPAMPWRRNRGWTSPNSAR